MIEEVFENLVEQFSDPFTFLRELIQNAMDAGSNQVDVTVEYQADKERILVTVTDSGEGMNQQIIQEQLTKLFSSTKEHDFTKIGKFGIGFVSVFAIEPELVVVDTGRGGEYWRIGFDGTTDYQLLRLNEPVEGTTVKVYKKLSSMEVDEFIERCKQTISFWCRYSDTQVTFNGNPINEQLRVDSPCQIVHQQTGTTVVAGVTAAGQPHFGLYNRGLTLKEGFQDQLPGVTYRIKSVYLEHTLTRDNVLQDENFKKAMAILDRSVRHTLLPHVFDELNRLAQHYPEGGREKMDTLCDQSLPLLTQKKNWVTRELRQVPIAPRHHGPPLSLEDLRKAHFWEGSLYVDEQPNAVTAEFARLGVPVLRTALGSPVSRFFGALVSDEPRQASMAVATPQVLANQPQDAAFRNLSTVLVALLKCGQTAINMVRLAEFDYPGSCVANIACLAQHHPNEPIRLFKRGFWRSWQRYPGVLLLNHSHPLVKKALLKAYRDPTLAAFVLAKAALLQDGLPQDLEAKIVSRTWKYA